MAEGQTIILGTERAAKELVRIAIAAPRGSIATVTPPRRTIPQNAKMHAMLSDIARAKPGGRVLPPRAWKCLFMEALAAETNNAKFTAQWEPGLDGTGFVNLGYRSSRLVKAEMGELIDFIQSWGDENGVQWSDAAREAA